MEPAYTSTSTVAASPVAVPAEPVTVSTASLTTAPSAGLVRVTAGAWSSPGVLATVTPTALLVPRLPAASDWVTWSV